jgi:hypothetical protein
MFVTLLLPIVVPYGNPVTAHNPKVDSLRKAEFFKWIESVKHKQYHQVPLLYSNDVEKHKAGFRTKTNSKICTF